MDNIKKIKRTAKLISVLTKYGFETLVCQTGLKKFIPDSYIEKNEKRKEVFSLTVYERIRLTLEELGPAYIKLGQLMSNRDDILPAELTTELQKLQDNVTVKNIDLHATLKEELNINVDDVFTITDTHPIAAASLSQVYIATLKENNKKIVIKVKRKGIRDIIEADILIMKDFSQLLEKYYEAARSIGLVTIVNTFEKSIIGELSFSQELSNMERFRKNFRENQTMYVPETYKNLSNKNILCMEYIDGIKVSDKEKLLASGLDLKQIASLIVDLYIKQIIEHGFFHADPHSGNIFVLPESKQIAFIDYGSMGQLLSRDEENIEDFILFALRKDTRRLLLVIKKIAVKYNIPDEKRLERELYEFLDILDNNSIKNLDVGSLISRFGRLLNENKIILPEFIYLLVRGIVLLEGIGRELGIETNIIENVRPYSIEVIKRRLSPKYIIDKTADKLFTWGERLNDIPDDVHDLLKKVNNGELKVNHSLKGLADIKVGIDRLVIAILVFALAVGSSLLILAKMPPLAWGVSVLGFLGFLFAGIIAVLIILSIFTNKKPDK
jgi:ubiquinone biosynthesis protein